MTDNRKPKKNTELQSALFGKKPKTSDEHKFWDTQPVPKLHEKPKDVGPIDRLKTPDDVPAEPYALPPNFYWKELDLTQDEQIEEMYKLLTHHYVEDDDNMFRFDYSREFLRWALLVPDYKPCWHVGIRTQPKGRLVACITAIPADITIYDDTIPMVEINFLCVHKKLRNKRLAPVLIKEITRRVNREDRWQAVYTAGVVLPKPVSKNRYWHRSLNPKKLISIGFSRLPQKLSMNGTIRLYSLPEDPVTPNLIQLTEEDVPSAYELLMKYLLQFKLHTHFTLDEFRHWMSPRDGVVDCWVVKDPKDGKVTDMLSFYALPSSVINNPTYRTLKAAYSFYNVATTVDWKTLMKDALILAKKSEFDVFNALDVMENKKFLETLNFGIGDGHLQYYLYNYKCPEIEAHHTGIVLL